MLGIDRRVQPMLGRVEGGAEGIPNNLEDIAAVSFDCLAQYGVMARQGLSHDIGELLPELRATLNIGKQESDCASRPVRACHDYLCAVRHSWIF